MLTLMTPWALLLLLLLPAAAIVAVPRLRRLPGQRGPIALALRLSILTLLVLALAGPQWRTMVSKVAVVFLVDASHSVGTSGEHAGMDWATRANAAAGPHDEAGVVVFGAAPRLAVPLAHYRRLPDPSGDPGNATDIGAALRLGLSILPPGQASRLVLLSDGWDTAQDGLQGAEALALARHVPIDTVAVVPAPRRDAAVRVVDVSPVVREGDRVPIRVTIHSSYATNATLTLWIDGQAAQQTVPLHSGDNVFATEQSLSRQGSHTIRAQIAAPGDAVPQNDALSAATVVAPAGRVLLAVHNPAAATGLATTLAHAHLSVVPVLASSLPATAAGLRGYDEVILDNVPATGLSRAQQKALRGAVYSQGIGLLAIGGPNSFGEGGYAHTPIEDALPVASVSTPRRVSAPLALMLVIDKSGSMADAVDGVAKIDMVKVAASSALDRLSNGDAVGVLAFDDSNHWIVPFHTLQGQVDKARIRRQIATLSADGDTYIYPALKAAEQAVLRIPTIYRHVVLLTDGQGEDADFTRLITRMHHEHITLSTIGVGEDVVQDELRTWARLGGGNFHYVSDPHDIPRIVVNEARYGSSGTATVTGHIHLGVAAASPLLRALSGHDLRRMTVNAYDSSIPKATAQVVLQSASGDPVLSSWQYGLGRSVAWVSDAATWAASWSPQRQPGFWLDLVRWTMRGYDPSATAPTLQAQNGVLQVSTQVRHADGSWNDDASPRVRVQEPDGSAQVLPLALSGPGSYTAQVPLAGAGVYTAAFVRNDRSPTSPAAVAAVAVPYAAEYAHDGVNSALLTNLADVTGGQALARPAEAFTHAGVPPAASWVALWPWLLALALLLFPLDVGVRLLLPREPIYRTPAG